MISRQSAENYLSSKNEHVEDVMTQHRRRRVYVNAVFDIDHRSNLPATKLELVQLLRQGKVVPFHNEVCKPCHAIPNFDIWQKQDRLSGE